MPRRSVVTLAAALRTALPTTLATALRTTLATTLVTALATASAVLATTSASAAPLVPGATMPEPMDTIVTPDWSGMDVRTPDDLPALPAQSGVPVEEVPLAPAQRLPSAGEVQQRFAYTTVDQHGNIAASTAAVFLPTGDAPADGWPVLAWAHGTTGLGDNCTPSAGSRNDRDLVDRWVDAGYAVVASDYTGLGTPGLMSYFNGEATAVSVVDAVIAAHGLDSLRTPTDLEAATSPAEPDDPDNPTTLTDPDTNHDGTGSVLSTRWAVAGQSQGGGAALHVAHDASDRSTDAGLDYRGAVATGAPGYIEEVMLALGPDTPPVPLPGTLSAYLLYTVAGFREAHPELDVDASLSTEGRRMVGLAETTCLREFRRALDGVNIATAFTGPLREVPGLEPALRAYMATPTDGYDRPVFLGHGLTDVDVPSPVGVALNSELWVNQFTGSNAQVEVHWYPTDHAGVMTQSFGDAAAFLGRIMG